MIGPIIDEAQSKDKLETLSQLIHHNFIKESQQFCLSIALLTSLLIKNDQLQEEIKKMDGLG